MVVSVASDAARASAAPCPPAESTLVILVAAVLSTAIRATVQARMLLEHAADRARQDRADTVAPVVNPMVNPMVDPVVDAAFELALRAAAIVAGAEKVLIRSARPIALVALRPPILPSRFWPQTRLAPTIEHGRRARANADQVTAQLSADLLTTVLDHIDLAGIANQVIDQIDLPAIIRESSGAMTSEAVLGIRIRGIEADERVNRMVDRVLLRRQHRHTLTPAQGAGSD